MDEGHFSGSVRNIIAGNFNSIIDSYNFNDNWYIISFVSCASYDYIPFPSNVTTSNQTLTARDFLLNALQPYRGIFDLNT